MQLCKLEEKRMALHAHIASLAFGQYLRHGQIDPMLTRLLNATSSKEALLKYNPDQPRVPAGHPDGGQWTSVGGELNPFPDVTSEGYREPGLGHPPIIEMFSGLTTFGARAAIRIAAGLANAANTSKKISRAAKAIETYFGGPPKFDRNKSGDMYLMKDNKKIRFDINNYSPHDQPHFHIEEMGSNLRWKKIGDKTYHPFRKGK